MRGEAMRNPTNSNKAVIYLRVSTDEQHTENQTPDLMRYAEHNGLEVVETYVDHAVSGRKRNRPALDRLREDLKADKFSTVLFYKVDRVGRDAMNVLNLRNEFDQHNVRMVVTTQGIDSSNPTGKLMLTILAGIAEAELDTLVERTKAGLARTKANGTVLGGSKPKPFNAHQAQQLLSEGRSHQEISRLMNVPRATLYRKLAAA
jgi:DNA invertase Pin-like site-specific DNA recombinase